MSAENYFAVLYKQVWLILGCALGAGLVVFILTFIVPPTYEAEAGVALVKTGVELEFDPKFKTVSDLDAARNLIDQTARRKTLATIANSSDMAKQVIGLLGTQVPEKLREPSKILEEVNARSDGDMIRISARAPSAEQAALIANTWARVFVERINAVYGSGPLTSTELQAQADSYKQGYDRAETALVTYVASNPTSQLERVVQEKQAALSDSLVVGIRLDRMITDAQALRERLASNPVDSSVGNALAKMVLEANGFSAATNLSTGTQADASGPITLQFQIDAQALSTNPAQLASEMDSLLKTLTARRDQIRSRDVTQLQQEVNQLRSQLEQENARVRELTQARDLAWDTYTTLATKVAEVTVAEQAKGNVVQIAITAVNPTEPVEPRRTLYTLLAVLGGLVLGLVLAFLPSFLNRYPQLRPTIQPRSKSAVSP